jgi:ATP-dependent Clp protease protease subunit
MGALILAAGEPGSRFALPHARIMLHQPFARLGDVKRTADDVQLHAIELSKTRATLLELVARATGKSAEEISCVFDKDSYFTAEEARELGVIDAIADSIAMIEPNAAAKPRGPASKPEATQTVAAADGVEQDAPAVS